MAIVLRLYDRHAVPSRGDQWQIACTSKDYKRNFYKRHGEEMASMIDHLNDPDKSKWTYSHIFQIPWHAVNEHIAIRN